MKKVFVLAVFAVIAIAVFAPRVHASEISLADECGILLSTHDDASTLSAAYNFRSGQQYVISVKPNFSFSSIFVSKSSVLSNSPGKISFTLADLYSRENPHFRFFVKLE